MTAPTAPPPLPSLPRVDLLGGPTPLHPLRRLSAALGDRAELWIKREDLGPLAFSGNKLRNLEFLLGAALAEGADTIVTSGRRWSNHCRLTAAAGARLGLVVHLVVNGPPVDRSPNLALIEELGGIVHQAPDDSREARATLAETVVAAATAEGGRVKVIPVGGSEPVGAWGHVLALLEAADQAHELGFQPDAIVLPTATGGTQAGLVAGAARRVAEGGHPVAIHGIAVHPDPDLGAKVVRLVAALAAMASIEPPSEAIRLSSAQIGPGYGIPTAASRDAAALLARSEGILVDPIYTAKALAGLVTAVRAGELDGRRVVFWHGGGLPALFEAGVAPA